MDTFIFLSPPTSFLFLTNNILLFEIRHPLSLPGPLPEIYVLSFLKEVQMRKMLEIYSFELKETYRENKTIYMAATFPGILND